MTIVSVLGTRPEIIKMAPLLPGLDGLGRHVIVHSGQHYSAEMDAIFFRELQLRAPDRFLEVGSIAPADQVARVATGVERVIMDIMPDWVIVHGDTNTTLGGALAAAKHRHEGVRLAHVEAGARSFNRSQPEELNRILVDAMSDLLFAPTEDDAANLKREGIAEERVLVTGNTVVESCLRMVALLAGEVPAGLRPHEYAVATIHRQETVDSEANLEAVWRAIARIGSAIPVVVPLHPRSRKMLACFGISNHATGVDVREPVGYKEMTRLLNCARFCLTDSGGVQEEAAILQVPTLILRNETEHMRYVQCGLHRIVGCDENRIVAEAELLVDPKEWHLRRNAKLTLDEGVSRKILDALTG